MPCKEPRSHCHGGCSGLAMILQSSVYGAFPARIGQRRLCRAGLILFALALDVTFVLAPGCQIASTNSDIVSDQLIVSLRPGATQGDLLNLLHRQDATIDGELEGLSAYLVGVDPRNREQLARSLRGSPLVEEVLNNRLIDTEITPNDPDYAIQWFLQTTHAPEAWALTTGSGNVLVAVLDTGVDTSHPDLAGKLRTGANTYGDGSSYATTPATARPSPGSSGRRAITQTAWPRSPGAVPFCPFE